MCLYEFIKSIVLGSEPDSDDEFAVMDKIQEDANNISSIRERYMNAASATP